MINDKKIYESFHKKTRFQKKLISNNNFTYRILLRIINKYIGEDKNIFDIGCGAGVLSLYLANKGNNVLGIDISEKAIKSCMESANNLQLEKKVNFQAMDFPNEIPSKKFDFIICFEVIEHLKDDKLAFKKINFLLNKDGIVIISTPSKNAPLYKMGMMKKFDKRVGHLRRYTMDELSFNCEEAGFKILEKKKAEGILRNFLFINPAAGKSIRFIKYYISDLVSALDWISLKLFGEADLIIVAQKP